MAGRDRSRGTLTYELVTGTIERFRLCTDCARTTFAILLETRGPRRGGAQWIPDACTCLELAHGLACPIAFALELDEHAICTLYCEHSTTGCDRSRAYLAAHPDDPDVIAQLRARQ